MERRDKNKKQAVQEPKKTASIICLNVAAMDEDGYGLSKIEETSVKIAGVFPGESIRARIIHTGKESITARCLQLTAESPYERVFSQPAICKECENCPLIQLACSSQAKVKEDIVKHCISEYTSLKKTVLHKLLLSPKPFNYRTTAKLVVSGTFRTPKIGIYRRHSHEVMDIAECPIHHPLINSIVATVKNGIKKGKVPVYSPSTGSGILRYLVIRVSEKGDQAMVVFVTARRSYNEIHHLGRHLQAAVPEVRVLAQNENSSSGNVILGEKFHFLTKLQSMSAQIGEIVFSVSPRSFFQVNSEAARLIYDKVTEWGQLSGKETVVDVYCGTGGISLFLSKISGEVYGIEVVESAVTDAIRNARANGITNCRFEAGDARELLAELREDNRKVDLLVLNPPRKGCDRRVLEEVAMLGPGRLIYVSCSPWTLARDLNILAGLGYSTLEIQPVDMFPQTQHVESIALLVKYASQ